MKPCSASTSTWLVPGAGAEPRHDIGDRDSPPDRVELGPFGDAVDVEGPLRLRHVEHVLIRPGDGIPREALDPEIPLSELNLGRHPGVQHREAISHVLTRGHPRGIDAPFGQFCLFAPRKDMPGRLIPLSANRPTRIEQVPRPLEEEEETTSPPGSEHDQEHLRHRLMPPSPPRIRDWDRRPAPPE